MSTETKKRPYHKLKQKQSVAVIFWLTANMDKLKEMTIEQAAAKCSAEKGFPVVDANLRSLIKSMGHEQPWKRSRKKPTSQAAKDAIVGEKSPQRQLARQILALAAEVKNLFDGLGSQGFNASNAVDLDLLQAMASGRYRYFISKSLESEGGSNSIADWK